MKFVLINPYNEDSFSEMSEPSHGLGYLAAVIKNKGHDVKVLPGKLTRSAAQEIVKAALEYGPDAVGITAMTPDIVCAARIAGLIKKHDSNLLIIVGGAHVTALPEETLEEFSDFDIGVIGEGEETVSELTDWLSSGRDYSGLKQIKGLVFRDDSGRPLRTAIRPWIEDLDKLPFPAWELFPPPLNGRREFPVLASRGCPYQCKFCMRMMGEKIRRRSAGNILEELLRNRRLSETNFFWFSDETFGVDKAWLDKLLDTLIENKGLLNMQWSANSRVNLADVETYVKMKEAGCIEVYFGIESGNDAILANSCKGITTLQARDAVTAAREAGLSVGVFFILGHPGETLRTIWQTIRFAARLNTDIVVFGKMVPYPGTEIRQMAKKHQGGYNYLSSDWNDYVKYGRNSLGIKGLDPRIISFMQVLAYVFFYFRNLRFLGLIKFIRSHKATLKKIFFSAVVLLCSTVIAAAAEPRTDYSISAVNSLTKIFPEKDKFKSRFSDNFDISCARNETESFQVVLIPPETGLSNINIEISDLADEENKAFITRDNISLFRVGYVRTSRPYYNSPRVGLWPDPLFPLEPDMEVKRDSVQSVWVNITVPADAKSTDYTGYITVKPKDFKPKSVRLKLKVRNFALPRKAHLKTAFDLYEYLVDWRYPKREFESGAQYKIRLDKIKTGIYVDMLRHRLNPVHNVGNPVFSKDTNGVYALDFSEFDRKVEFYKKHGQATFGMAQEWPQNQKGDWSDAWYGFTGPEALEGVFREYARHLEEKGWLADAYAYMFDETLNRVKEVTAIIHKANPGVRNLITMTPREGYPDVDIWCVRINNLDDPAVRKFMDRGKEIWVYVAGPSFPYPSLNLDFFSPQYRIIPWICWKYKLSGFLYWCVNYWHNVNPLENPMTYPEQNGNGCLYYPDPKGESFVGSIRLEVLRDGMEDFEYLYLLQEKLKEVEYSFASDKILWEEIEDTLALPDSVVRDAAYYTSDADKLYAMRERIAQLIEEMDEP